MLLAPVPSHYPILLAHLSQDIQDATVLFTLTEGTQFWGTQKHLLNTVSKLVLLIDEYLPDV